MDRIFVVLIALSLAAPAATAALLPAVPVVVAQGNVPSKGGDADVPVPTEGGGEARAPQGDPPGMGSTLVVMGLIFAFFWLFFIRPQNKQVKQHETLVKDLKSGDNVVTQGGMFGRIVGFDDTTASVLLEIAKGTRVRVVRTQISRLQQQSGADQDKK